MTACSKVPLDIWNDLDIHVKAEKYCKKCSFRCAVGEEIISNTTLFPKLTKKVIIQKNLDTDDFENNPFAICKAKGKELGWSEEKIEECILSVKKKVGYSEHEEIILDLFYDIASWQRTGLNRHQYLQLRGRVWAEQNGKCIKCGKPCESPNWHLHHIDHNPKNNNRGNVVLYCSKDCHVGVHKSKEDVWIRNLEQNITNAFQLMTNEQLTACLANALEKYDLASISQGFRIIRNNDVNGHSGTGVVIEGIIFENGKVVIRWMTEQSSLAIFDSWQDFYDVHIGQHPENDTEIKWYNLMYDQTDPQKFELQWYERNEIAWAFQEKRGKSWFTWDASSFRYSLEKQLQKSQIVWPEKEYRIIEFTYPSTIYGGCQELIEYVQQHPELEMD